ncbi:MAG: hypothetical protein ACRD3C_12975 [Vicinamibacterales bacterium]
MWAWAHVAGIPDELFWTLSVPEVEAVVERQNELERAKYLRAGLVAATILNVNRKPGTPLVKPGDFLRERPRPEDFWNVDEARAFLDRWAEAQNAIIDRS